MAVQHTGRFKSRIPEIIRNLDPAIDHAILEAAAIVEAKAKALVPKKAGALERAIHVERRFERGRVLTFVTAWSHEAFYGHFVEFGHDGKSGHVAAHPFMVPAAESSRDDIKRLGRHAVEDACK